MAITGSLLMETPPLFQTFLCMLLRDSMHPAWFLYSAAENSVFVIVSCVEFFPHQQPILQLDVQPVSSI